MTNEQIIKGLTKMLDDTIEANECGLSNNDFKDDIELLKSALSLIKEQQGEIEGLKNKEVLIKRYFKKCDLIKQLTKQIDLMAEYWNTGLAMCDNCDRIVEKYEKNNCKDCIKQYFADKAKIEQ